MIKDIDKRMHFSSELQEKNIDIYNALEDVFSVHGMTRPDSEDFPFRRMPTDIAESVSPSIFELHKQTPGGRIRFATDSDYIGIHAKLDNPWRISNTPLSCTAGFDLYRTEDGAQKHIKAFLPPADFVDEFCSEWYLPEKKNV